MLLFMQNLLQLVALQVNKFILIKALINIFNNLNRLSKYLKLLSKG